MPDLSGYRPLIRDICVVAPYANSGAGETVQQRLRSVKILSPIAEEKIGRHTPGAISILSQLFPLSMAIPGFTPFQPGFDRLFNPLPEKSLKLIVLKQAKVTAALLTGVASRVPSGQFLNRMRN